MVSARELDEILEKMITIIKNNVEKAMQAELYLEDIKDLAEAAAVVLSVGYSRLKDESK